MNSINLTLDYIHKIITLLILLETFLLGVYKYKNDKEKNKLKEENELFLKKINKITSKVDPESDRRLIQEANDNIGIIGINSLGPLHHCREEIIDFLKNRNGVFNIILLDPTSKAFKKRASKEDDKSNRLISEWKASLSILKDIETKSGRKINLRFRGDSPDRSLLIIDALNGTSDRSKMLINYYPEESDTRGYTGCQFLSEFIMKRDRDSFIKNLNYYKYIWSKRSKKVAIEDYYNPNKLTQH